MTPLATAISAVASAPSVAHACEFEGHIMPLPMDLRSSVPRGTNTMHSLLGPSMGNQCSGEAECAVTLKPQAIAQFPQCAFLDASLLNHPWPPPIPVLWLPSRLRGVADLPGSGVPRWGWRQGWWQYRWRARPRDRRKCRFFFLLCCRCCQVLVTGFFLLAC